MFNFNTAIHMPTASQPANGQHKNCTKKHFVLQKECSHPCDFCAAQEKKVPMVQIYIYVFLKISDLESLWKIEHFCVKLKISAHLELHISKS